MHKRHSSAQTKGFLETQTPSIREFWPLRTPELTQNLQYESFVYSKSSGLFFKSFSQHWLGFSSPFLYFAEVCFVKSLNDLTFPRNQKIKRSNI